MSTSNKPTTVPRWADPNGLLVVPPSGKQDIGWLTAEKPPSEYMNWLEYWQNQWCKFVDSYFSLSATAQGDTSLVGTQTTIGQIAVRGASESTTTAPFIASDPGGPARWIIDHLGYPGGGISEWEEHWRTSGTTLPTGWTATITNSATGTMTDPSSAFTQRYNLVVLPGAASTPTYTLTPEYTNYLDNTGALVLEATVGMPSSFSGGGTNYDFGLQLSHGGANDYFVVFSFIAGTGNWRCRVIGSSTVNNDSGITPAVNTNYRLRIEVTGSTVSGLSSGTFKARFFINGSLVQTITFTTPGADKIRPYFKSASTTSGTGDVGIKLGRIRYCFNHLLTSDTY